MSHCPQWPRLIQGWFQPGHRRWWGVGVGSIICDGPAQWGLGSHCACPGQQGASTVRAGKLVSFGGLDEEGLQRVESSKNKKTSDSTALWGFWESAFSPGCKKLQDPLGTGRSLLDLGWTWSRKGLTCQPFEASWAHCGQGGTSACGDLELHGNNAESQALPQISQPYGPWELGASSRVFPAPS